MMDPHALAIPLGFILLSAVLCLLLIGSKWKWWQKLLLIVTVPSFGLAVWSSLGSYKGWPTTAAPPEKALVYWVLVREPEPARGDPGAIFVWLTPVEEDASGSLNPLDYDSPGGEPRAYKLPYSRSLHQATETAKNIIGRGQPAVLELHEPRGEEPPGDGEEREGGRPSEGGQQGSSPRNPGYGENDIRVYPLPPALPPKNQ